MKVENYSLKLIKLKQVKIKRMKKGLLHIAKRLLSFNTIKKLSPLGGWGTLLLFSCSSPSSTEDYVDEHEVRFGVGFADVWKEGSFNGGKAKAVTRGELTRLDPPMTPVLYKVFVKATSKGNAASQLDLTLTNMSSSGALNPDGVTEFDITPADEIKEDNYTLFDYEARTIIPEDYTAETSYDNVWGAGTIPLYGTVDYLSGTGITEVQNLRVYFPLHHNTVLVRFVLGVGREIDAIRTLRLTSLMIYRSTALGTDGKPEYDTADESTAIAVAEIEDEGADRTDALTVQGRKYIEFHVNPASQEQLEPVLIVATYDVYDKSGQLLRKDCTARNTLALGFTPQAKGRYYDIYATIKPDFLYVLSDDDKETADVVLR